MFICSFVCMVHLIGASGWVFVYYFFFFFKQKTAYEMRISDWSSDVCSSDLTLDELHHLVDLRIGVIERLHMIGRLAHLAGQRRQIGRASCRERVCQYV